MNMKKCILITCFLQACSPSVTEVDGCVSCRDALLLEEINEENACKDSLPKFHNFMMNTCAVSACQEFCKGFCQEEEFMTQFDLCDRCLAEQADQYGDEFYTHFLKCWSD